MEPPAGGTPLDRVVNPEIVAWFEELGSGYGWTLEGAKALKTDETLRASTACPSLDAGNRSWFLTLAFAWHVCGSPTLLPTAPLLEALDATEFGDTPPAATRLSGWPVLAVVLPGEGVEVEFGGSAHLLSALIVGTYRQLPEAASDAQQMYEIPGLRDPRCPPRRVGASRRFAARRGSGRRRTGRARYVGTPSRRRRPSIGLRSRRRMNSGSSKRGRRTQEPDRDSISRRDVPEDEARAR